MTPQQLGFLEYEFITSSLLAAFATRRKTHPIYAAEVTDSQRNEVKQWVRSYLVALGKKYRSNDLTETEHVNEIRYLTVEAGKRYPLLLHKGEFRFGVAQKLINVYLKYLWAVGAVNSVHHCPLDGIINSEVDLRYEWTTSNSESQYLNAISKLRAQVGTEPLQVWEIRVFQNTRGEA